MGAPAFRRPVTYEQEKHENGNHQGKGADGQPTHGFGGCVGPQGGGGERSGLFRREFCCWKANDVHRLDGGDHFLCDDLQGNQMSPGAEN